MLIMFSIIVSVYERPELLANFIEHLLHSIKTQEYEIVFVVDGPQNIQIYNILRDYRDCKHVKVVELDERSGFSIANNVGVEQAQHDILVFANTDCFPAFGSIETLVDTVSLDATVGGAQAVLLYPQTDRIQSCGHVYGDYFSKHLFSNRRYDEQLVEKVIQRQSVTAALVAIRKQVFVKCGRFSESYFNAFEGKELSLRVHASGLRNVVVPDAKAYHLQGATRENGYIDKYSQLGRFWARCNDVIQNEIVDIFKLQTTTEMQERRYQGVVVDFYKDWTNLAEDTGIVLRDSIFLGPVERAILIEDILPSSLLRSPEPIAFMLESIRWIQGNRKWLDSRNGQGDIVMDRHGNIMPLSQL